MICSPTGTAFVSAYGGAFRPGVTDRSTIGNNASSKSFLCTRTRSQGTHVNVIPQHQFAKRRTYSQRHQYARRRRIGDVYATQGGGGGGDEMDNADIPVETTRVPEEGALDPEAGSVTIPATFNLAGGILFLGGAACYAGDGWLLVGLPLTALGSLLAFQTIKLRFVFGPNKFSLARKTKDGLKLFVGWEYGQITNWEIFWKPFPILAYFKETESYNGRGSIHFFPMMYDRVEMLAQLRKRTPHLDKANYD